MWSSIILTLINWFGAFVLVNTIFDRLSGIQIQYKSTKPE